ncbi:hypothetical protein LTR53_006112 [Teratosphaeriaceae sp. CCFEE 6253]|nr:hypothetical protein LTR53_006112 [Teratosphaeriaceae sp. CCFEE 6253]
MPPPSRPRARVGLASDPPAASSKPSKRTHTDMDGDDGDVSEFKPAKKGKKPRQAIPSQQAPGLIPPLRQARADVSVYDNVHPRQPAQPGTSVFQLKVREEKAPTIPGLEPSRAVPADQHVTVRLADSKRPASATQLELESALAEVDRLSAHLAKAEHDSRQGIMRARQDQIFHIEAANQRLAALQEKYRKVASQHVDAENRVTTLEQQSCRYSELAAARDARIKKLEGVEAQRALLQAQVSSLIVERNFFEDDATHYSRLLSTAEGDLQQLQQIETEDRALKESAAMKETLPPAYGSLPGQDDPRAPHEEVDGGSLEVATFKRTIRRSFMNAHSRARTLACQKISDVLRRSTEVYALSIRTRKPDGLTAQLYNIRRQDARKEYVADRFAKLILDLVVRTLAAMEIRPLSGHLLRPRDKTEIRLAWYAVDECILKALRTVFNRSRAPRAAGSCRADGLVEVQYYLTQVSLLRNRLQAEQAVGGPDHVPSRGPGAYFSSTEVWLQEKLESERAARATLGDEDDALLTDDESDVMAMDDEDDGLAMAESGTEQVGNGQLPPRRATPFDPATEANGVTPQASTQTTSTGAQTNAAARTRNVGDPSTLPSARDTILQGRAAATGRRMGTYRRVSDESRMTYPNNSLDDGRQPPSAEVPAGGLGESQRLEAVEGVRHAAATNTNIETRGNTSQRSRRTRDVSISSEPTPEPSEAGEGNDAYVPPRRASASGRRGDDEDEDDVWDGQRRRARRSR